jgi:hypothetical protein
LTEPRRRPAYEAAMKTFGFLFFGLAVWFAATASALVSLTRLTSYKPHSTAAPSVAGSR